MPKKREPVKGGAPMPKIREDSRLMRTHESMVDFIHGRPPTGSIMDLFTSGLVGLDFLRTLEGELEDDIVYSDDDDDYDDHPCKAHNAAYNNLKPHPRIKQLTNEEADKHAKDLLEEEERRKDKTVKNKRKKLRKKEKKRFEKENAVKDILPEEEKGKSDSSDNLMENPVSEIKTEAKDSPESCQTPNGPKAASCDEKRANNTKENLKEVNKTEDQQQKQDFDLNNSSASTTKSVAEETRSERPAAERKKKKNKLLDVSPPKEEKPKVVEKLKVKKKKEEKQKPNEERPIDPAAEESAQRSRELAAFGNRLAALGQYETAVQCFTDAIKYNPQESKLFGNRSLCYERLQQYDNALSDADQALSMEPNWIKGLFRKGKALCGLKRYYEASLIYREVLKLDASSGEAEQELKRAQTLHLMEMGFNWAQSSAALKTHATLEQAVEALFGEEDVGACRADVDPLLAAPPEADGGEWIHLRSRSRIQRVKQSDAQSRSTSRSPTPLSGNPVKLEIFSVWVGSLSPAITYSTLHELFSRAGTVHSIKMLLEQQCVFVNYTSVEDCDRAIQCFNGMVVEGSPLSVRYPNKFRFGAFSSAASDPFPRLNLYKKECFFWRTVGCTRLDCTFRHVPEHKNVDKDKFSGRNVNM
uniref:uncharacterized protein si:dkey-33c12.4 n=1 Tax=Gasterosteus aculeatus aculeatus TaxID=481459 RepID=UPI001A9A0F0A|nr:uncharacterized protein si:dkey-33c12.4 [Gasterosteus aculeatus aculeatus]